MSSRRTKAVEGFVNFPVNKIESSQEGGMSVMLVVIDEKGPKCCAPNAYITYNESYIRDDNRPFPVSGVTEFSNQEEFGPNMLDVMNAEQKENQAYEAYHFPNLRHDEEQGEDAKENIYRKYTSRAYSCAFRMGSTGWSGYVEKAGCYWHCTYEDLKPEGKALYNLIRKLYPKAKLHLQTWLDT